MSVELECRRWPLGNGMVLEDLHVAHLRKWRTWPTGKTDMTLFEAIADHCRHNPDICVPRVKQGLLDGTPLWPGMCEANEERSMLGPLALAASRRARASEFLKQHWFWIALVVLLAYFLFVDRRPL